MEEIQYRFEIMGDDCLYYADRMRKPLMLAALISVILTVKSGRESSSFMKSKLQGLGFLGGSKNEMTYGGFGGGSYGGSSFGSSYSPTTKQATAALMDAYSNVKAAKGGQFKDFGSTTTFAGEMVTLKSIEAASPVEDALSSPGTGKVLVVDGGGSTRAAIFDVSMANKATSNGWAGVIINGCVRNVESLKSVSIGIKAICTHPERGKGRSHKKGAKLKIAGTIFSQGKYVYADPDGIVVSKTQQQPVSGLGGSSYGSFGGTSSSYGTGSSYGGSATSGYGAGTSSYGTGSTGSTGSYGASAGGGYSGGTSSYGTGNSYGAATGGGYGGGTSSYGTGSTGSYGASSGGGYSGGSTGGGYSGGTTSYGTGSTGSYGGGGGVGGMGTSNYGTATGGGYNGGAATGGGFSGGGVQGGGYSGAGGGGGGGGFSGGNFRRLRTRVATE